MVTDKIIHDNEADTDVRNETQKRVEIVYICLPLDENG